MTTRVDPTPREQREAMGRAIREMRLRAGPDGDKISTLAAAAKIGVTRQTWEKYENAKGDAILRQDVQAVIARGLGVTREDLEHEYFQQLPPRAKGANDVGERPASFLGFPPATTRRVMMEDDTLRPWAAYGQTIVYDIEQPPQPEGGCVVELPDGERLVKIFVRADADAFHLAEISPARREFSVPREGAKAYRVVARLG